MSAIKQSSRAGGSNRGGVGGGYERTDPEYQDHRIKRMILEHDSLDRQWRATYLDGLTKWEREHVDLKTRNKPETHNETK